VTIQEAFDFVRNRGISITDLADAPLTDIISDSLSEFSTYYPKVSLTTGKDVLVTVADQSDYEKPTDSLWILDVFWHPLLNETLTLTDLQESLPEYRDFAINHIYLQNYQDYKKIRSGNWDIINDKIWLFPTPSADDIEIPVMYATAQSLLTMNIVDVSLFKNFVYYTCLTLVGADESREGGWTAGSYKVSESAGKNLLIFAERHLARLRMILGNKGKVKLG